MMSVAVYTLTELHTTEPDLNAALMIVSDNPERAKWKALSLVHARLIDFTKTLQVIFCF